MVTKLGRLARSLPDARDIAGELTSAGAKPNIGGALQDPDDPVGRLLFNVLAMIAEFELNLIRMRTREGMKVAGAKGRLHEHAEADTRGPQPGTRCTPALKEPRFWRNVSLPVRKNGHQPRREQRTAE